MPYFPLPTGGLPQVIDQSNFTTVLTYTSPSWAVQQYREVFFNLYLATTDGATQPFVSMTGLAGTNRTQITYSSSTTAAGFSDATHWNTGILTSGELKGSIILQTNRPKAFLGQAFSGTTAFTISGENNDVVSSPTALVLTFASASTGRIELWGWPS